MTAYHLIDASWSIAISSDRFSFDLYPKHLPHRAVRENTQIFTWNIVTNYTFKYAQQLLFRFKKKKKEKEWAFVWSSQCLFATQQNNDGCSSFITAEKNNFAKSFTGDAVLCYRCFGDMNIYRLTAEQKVNIHWYEVEFWCCRHLRRHLLSFCIFSFLFLEFEIRIQLTMSIVMNCTTEWNRGKLYELWYKQTITFIKFQRILLKARISLKHCWQTFFRMRTLHCEIDKNA